AFDAFVGNIPFYGFAAICLDNVEAQRLVGRTRDRRVVTYGLSPQADVRAVDLEPGPTGWRFAVALDERARGGPRRIDDLFLPMLGEHNVLNACAAITVANELGVSDEALRAGFRGFEGVKRRFTRTGLVGGVAIVDDYGHHPVEIAAVLKAARASARGRVMAVAPPHPYSRRRDLFEEFCTGFNDAHRGYFADVYAAGETPIDGVDADALVAGLRDRGHLDARRLAAPTDLAAAIAEDGAPGDVVVCLGAGSITAWANALPRELEALGFGGGA
ncbi:MAG: cyanophycin synthetase, partial [Pseudomonadota bacterium]